MNNVIRWDEWGKDFNPAAVGMHCNIEQYRMLQRCSDNQSMTEWNQWRRKHRGEAVWLCGADLNGFHLNEAHLHRSHLEGASLLGASLRSAFLANAHLCGAALVLAHLEGAQLLHSHLDGADLTGAYLKDAGLDSSRFTDAVLKGTDLRDARAAIVDLEGARLEGARLERADFTAAIVNGRTMIWNCLPDRKTDFTGVGLDGACVEPGLKQLLKANIREKRWREWCANGTRWHRNVTARVVRAFWWISDYGRSTSRILFTFFILAFAFGGLYHVWPNLVETSRGVGGITNFWHALYFSVVTMTTLGFGDIHANPASWLGQTVLMAQVILGYVLLGALVTRFAILFSGEGPAANPTPLPKERDEDD